MLAYPDGQKIHFLELFVSVQKEYPIVFYQKGNHSPIGGGQGSDGSRCPRTAKVLVCVAMLLGSIFRRNRLRDH